MPDSLFWKEGDDWYRVDRMHDDRIGEGPFAFHNARCAIDYLEQERAIGEPPRAVRPVTRSVDS